MLNLFQVSLFPSKPHCVSEQCTLNLTILMQTLNVLTKCCIIPSGLLKDLKDSGYLCVSTLPRPWYHCVDIFSKDLSWGSISLIWHLNTISNISSNSWKLSFVINWNRLMTQISGTNDMFVRFQVGMQTCMYVYTKLSWTNYISGQVENTSKKIFVINFMFQ